MENKVLRWRKVTTEVKGDMITFDECYRVDSTTQEEIFDRDVEIENDIKLYDIYKKRNGLLTATEIKSIREKYNMNQKEYALSIGVGEITVHRFENGSVQTEAVDSIMKLSANPEIMEKLLIKNYQNLTEDSYNKFINIVKDLKQLQKHRIAKYDICELEDKEFETVDVELIAVYLINKYNKQCDLLAEKYNIPSDISSEYMTHLKLQKLLYYIQGLSLSVYNKPAFNNAISAWSYGPVVSDIYYKYKEVGSNPLKTMKTNLTISEGLNKIIEMVIESYGKLETGVLIDLTHEEDPWLTTSKNKEITQMKIKKYFDKVYNKKSRSVS
jgi:putative zinc finger/helix-turn-helix YgiT family protein